MGDGGKIGGPVGPPAYPPANVGGSATNKPAGKAGDAGLPKPAIASPPPPPKDTYEPIGSRTGNLAQIPAYTPMGKKTEDLKTGDPKPGVAEAAKPASAATAANVQKAGAANSNKPNQTVGSPARGVTYEKTAQDTGVFAAKRPDGAKPQGSPQTAKPIDPAADYQQMAKQMGASAAQSSATGANAAAETAKWAKLQGQVSTIVKEGASGAKGGKFSPDQAIDVLDNYVQNAPNKSAQQHQFVKEHQAEVNKLLAPYGFQNPAPGDAESKGKMLGEVRGALDVWREATPDQRAQARANQGITPSSDQLRRADMPTGVNAGSPNRIVVHRQPGEPEVAYRARVTAAEGQAVKKATDGIFNVINSLGPGRKGGASQGLGLPGGGGAMTPPAQPSAPTAPSSPPSGSKTLPGTKAPIAGIPPQVESERKVTIQGPPPSPSNPVERNKTVSGPSPKKFRGDGGDTLPKSIDKGSSTSTDGVGPLRLGRATVDIEGLPKESGKALSASQAEQVHQIDPQRVLFSMTPKSHLEQYRAAGGTEKNPPAAFTVGGGARGLVRISADELPHILRQKRPPEE